MNRFNYTVEQRGRATVGYRKGSNHHLYEDRFRLLTADIEIVAEAARGEVFAVFDGMGGLPEGMHAAQHMADRLFDFFECPAEHPATPQSLAWLLASGGAEIHAWGKAPGSSQPKGGCVGTVAWLQGETVHLFHVGDTEAWLSPVVGEVRRVTESETVGHAVARFYGGDAEMTIVPAAFRLPRNARLLLTSDGLRNAAVASHVPRIVAGRASPHETVAELCGVAAAARAHDDVTVLLVTGGAAVVAS